MSHRSEQREGEDMKVGRTPSSDRVWGGHFEDSRAKSTCQNRTGHTGEEGESTEEESIPDRRNIQTQKGVEAGAKEWNGCDGKLRTKGCVTINENRAGGIGIQILHFSLHFLKKTQIYASFTLWIKHALRKKISAKKDWYPKLPLFDSSTTNWFASWKHL